MNFTTELKAVCPQELLDVIKHEDTWRILQSALMFRQRGGTARDFVARLQAHLGDARDVANHAEGPGAGMREAIAILESGTLLPLLDGLRITYDAKVAQHRAEQDDRRRTIMEAKEPPAPAPADDMPIVVGVRRPPTGPGKPRR